MRMDGSVSVVEKHVYEIIGQACFCQLAKHYGVVMEAKAWRKDWVVYYLRTLNAKEVMRAPETKHKEPSTRN